jgi:hypothetical protein
MLPGTANGGKKTQNLGKPLERRSVAKVRVSKLTGLTRSPSTSSVVKTTYPITGGVVGQL